MRNQPDREYIDGVSVIVVLLGVIRCIMALASGNLEHQVLGTIAGFGIIAVGGLMLWLNRYNAAEERAAQEDEP